MKGQMGYWVTFIAAFAWHSGPSDAADTTGLALEEITVTATRREERVSQVPLSITALSDTVLAERGVIGFDDYAPSIPNVAFGYSGDSIIYSRAVLIRGITGTDTTGLYLDELPIPASMDPKVVDLDRIEVLRGPQGSLFGARSMGGTIRLLSKQPPLDRSEVSMRVRGEYVTDGGAGTFVQAGGSVPVIDDAVAVRAAAFYQYEPGVIKRVITGPEGTAQARIEDHYDAVSTRGARVAALVKPTTMSWLTLQPQFIFQETRYQGLPMRDNDADNREIRRVFDLKERQRDKWHIAGLTAMVDTDWGRFTSASNSWRRDAYASEDFSSFYTFFSPLVGGAEDFQSPAIIVADIEIRGLVQELRFASDWQSPFQLVAGAFWSKTETDSAIPPTIVAGWQDNLGSEFAQGDNVYSNFTSNDNTELAFYGEGRLALGERWSVTVGARWFRNEIDFSRFQDGWFVTGGAPDAGTLDAGKQRETDINPKFAIEWHPNGDTTVYASSARGFRTGGLNQTISQSLCDADLAAIGLTEAPGTFDSDKVQNYEVGLKARVLDRRMAFSGAAFRIDWTDIRQTVALACGFAFTANVGEARSEGFEAELSYRVTDALSIGMGAGYTDAAITAVGAGTSAEVGDRISLVPKWNGGVNIEVRRPIGALDWYGRTDATFVDERISTLTGTPLTVPSYELINVRSGVTWGDVDISLFIDNLTNEIPEYGTSVSLGSDTPGISRLHVGRPRTVGIELRMAL